MTDFETFAAEIGVSPQQLRQAEEKVDYIALPEEFRGRVSIQPSQIDRNGIVTNCEIANGEVVAPAMIGQHWTQAGRFANHSLAPNVKAKAEQRGLDFVAIRPILAGDEITVNYRQVRAAMEI